MSFAKINIGQPYDHVKNRGRFDLSCKSAGSANFGRIIPTYAKFIPMGSTLNINGVQSTVRVSPLAVPTEGDMSIKHYHCFVPYEKLYKPFNALISKTMYAFNNGTYIPQKGHMVRISHLVEVLSKYLSAHQIWQTESVKFVPSATGAKDTQISSGFMGTEVFAVWEGAGSHTLTVDEVKTVLQNIKTQEILPCIGQVAICVDETLDTLPLYDVYNDTIPSPVSTTPRVQFASSQSYDFNILISNIRLYFKYGILDKHLREIMIGLGYGNYFSAQEVSILPLMAYYYAWYNIFGIQKTTTFESTNIAKIIMYLANDNSPLLSSANYRTQRQEGVGGFLYDCLNACYTLAPDYYTVQTASNADNQLPSSILYHTDLQGDDMSMVIYSSTEYGSTSSTQDEFENYGLTNVLLEKMLRWVNVNTVVGRSVVNFMKAHFGVNPLDVEKICFGSSHTNIQVNDVISTAETQDAPIGDYRGFAMARDKSGHFSFDCKKSGLYVCLSVIVPNLGYYQGQESFVTFNDRFDFPTPEFDSVGKVPTTIAQFNSDVIDYKGAKIDTEVIGLRSRYLDCKVKHNTINGELRLNSMANQFNGYTLERSFGSVDSNTTPLWDESYRKIDNVYDHFNLNRIFQSNDNLHDHFFFFLRFEIHASMPMIPVSDSFTDTLQDGVNVVDKA